MENTVRKYNTDVFIAILILILPFLIYSHLLFSRYTSELIIFSYRINHWLDNNEVFIWFFLNDLIPFCLVLMMFFTTMKKWKYFLFPLLTFYFLSILRTFNIFSTLEETYLSLETIIFSLTLVACILIFDFYIAKNFRQVSSYANLLSVIRQNYKLDIRMILSKLSTLRAERYDLSLSQYFKKLFYLHLVVDKNLRSNYNSLNLIQSKDKRRIEKAILLLIIFMTFLWFLPYLFPKGLMKVSFASSIIDSNGFNDLRTFVWFGTRKFIVVLFLSIWFITSEYWWKYSILSPLIIFSYQFWESFGEVVQLDSFSNIKVFPLVVINILVVIAISKWVKYRTDLFLIYNVICREVDEMIEELKGDQLTEIAIKYKELKEEHSDKDVDYYKTKLKALEHELLNKLDLMKG